MHCIWLALAVALALPLPVARAQESFLSYPNIASDHVAGWSPNIFEFECGTPEGPERPAQADYSCVTLATREIFELTLDRAAAFYQAQGHWSPDGLGPVIDSYAAEDARDTVYDVVRTYADPASTAIAYVQPLECGEDPDMFMVIVPSGIEAQPKLVMSQTSAHELHHAILYGGTPGGGCGLADWVVEGMADALGWDFARKRLSSMFPVTHSAWKRRAVGQRMYNVPLNYDFSINAGPLATAEYRTSSLWNHIARRFHGGSFTYTRNYLHRYDKSQRNSDLGALKWLDAQLKADPEIRRGLYGVYPGFLTDYAGLWDSGDFGERFSRSDWLSKSFGSCLKAQVSPAAPYFEIDLGLRAMTGRCLSVEITGVEPQHAAFVKIGAFTGSVEVSDSLHLGFAFTNDQSGFNCAREARTGKLPRPLIGCPIEPVTGVFEHGGQSISSSRMWMANMIDPGLASQEETSAGAGIENVYILSYVPPVLEEARLVPARLNPNTSDPRMFDVKLGIGLEVSDLTVDGQQVSDPGADPDRSLKRKKALGATGNSDYTLDQLQPPTTGYIDTEGMMEGIFPDWVGMTEPLDFVRRPAAFLEAGYSPFASMVLTEAVVDPHGLPFSVWDHFPETTYHIFAKGMRPGATGGFQGVVFGHYKGLPQTHILTNKRETWARIHVEENSATVFRAKVSATLCEYDMLDTRQGGSPCLREVRISGSIVKPFAFLYRPGGTLRSLETPGEKLYNGYGAFGLPALLSGGGGSSGGGGGAGGGGGPGMSGGGSSGGGMADCDCACPPGSAPGQPRQCQAICAARWAQCQPPPKGDTDAGAPDLEALFEKAGVPGSARGAMMQSLEMLPPSARDEMIRTLEEQTR